MANTPKPPKAEKPRTITLKGCTMLDGLLRIPITNFAGMGATGGGAKRGPKARTANAPA